MDDGVELRADVFRPDEGKHPVILSYGPYAKGLAFQDGYPSAWQRMVAEHPDVAAGSTNQYQNWEVVDPEKWVPEGYACVRVDSRGARSRVTGQLVCGDETLSDKELAKNRCDFGDEILAHPLDDAYHKARSPDWDKVTVPLLSAANWGGQGLHPRGNFEGYLRAASKQKWLEAHWIPPWIYLFTDYGVQLQKRFFAHFMKRLDS